jgi:hypothetical protein
MHCVNHILLVCEFFPIWLIYTVLDKFCAAGESCTESRMTFRSAPYEKSTRWPFACTRKAITRTFGGAPFSQGRSPRRRAPLSAPLSLKAEVAVRSSGARAEGIVAAQLMFSRISRFASVRARLRASRTKGSGRLPSRPLRHCSQQPTRLHRQSRLEYP